MESQTIKALDGLTDAGVFEKVAMAVIRLLPAYAAIVHPGINAEGKTQKSPVDGICFIDANRRHMVVAHHTTTAAKELEKKWLFDPTTVNRRTTTKTPLPEPGDFLKTLEVVKSERQRTADLNVTLILTTNREPDEGLVRDVVSAGRRHNIIVDVWSRSAIASILDTTAAGHHIRRKLLGIEEELVSGPLLAELSQQNVRRFDAQDNVSVRVPRELDALLIEDQRPILFLVGPSGTGKTVACHKLLLSRYDEGGLAFVIPHQVVAASTSLDQALMATLQQIKPSLASQQAPSQHFELNRTTTLLIEDINASSDPRHLIEKIAGWLPSENDNGTHFPWRLICPVWPHLLAAVSSQTQTRIASMELRPQAMSAKEACAAVIARAEIAGVHLMEFEAAPIASALGNDPLLIALNDNWKEPSAELTISRFAEQVVNRAAGSGPLLAADLRHSLLDLGIAMLRRPVSTLNWNDLPSRLPTAQSLEGLRQVARNGELLHLHGPSRAATIKFRHDRVRDWIMAEAALSLHEQQALDDDLVAEPMLAEVMGDVLLRTGLLPALLERVARLNPLSLFHAIRLAGTGRPDGPRLIEATKSWLSAEENHNRSTKELRWQALAAIMDVEVAGILSIVELFPRDWVPGMIARMRNGDIEGGIDLCQIREAYTVAVWLKPAVDALRARQESQTTAKLSALVLEVDVADPDRCAALLNLAGIWGSAALGDALLKLWHRDTSRADRLDAYLWSLARCATTENASIMLGDLCDIWAALPEARDGTRPSPKDEMATDSVRWAFERSPPLGALPYLMDRAKQSDLGWQIEYLLHGLDHPDVVAFQAERGAERRRRSVDSYAVNSRALDHWRFAKDRGMATMSAPSRARLLEIWENEDTDENLRLAAYDLWSMNSVASELVKLAAHGQEALLEDRILRRRAQLGDRAVIPALIEKLTSKGNSWYWEYTQHLWSPELYDTLDKELAKLARSAAHPDKKADQSFTLLRVLLRLDAADTERLLLKYWDRLGGTPNFVQAALQVGSHELLARAERAIAIHGSPATLFKHLTMHYGVHTAGEAGITREAQILSLTPYFDFIEASDLRTLADVCNEHGWFATRRRWLDGRLDPDRAPLKRMFDTLEEAAQDARARPIEWDVEQLLESGETWGAIRGQLGQWLAQQTSQGALEVVARAVQRFGERDDVAVLDDWRGDDRTLVAHVRADTLFAVSRRTP